MKGFLKGVQILKTLKENWIPKKWKRKINKKKLKSSINLGKN